MKVFHKSMNAKILKSATIALLICVGVIACKKKDPVPNKPAPDKTTTMQDISVRYFIVKTNGGLPLGVIYFINEGGTKFYWDARQSRRIGTPVLSNVDAGKGSATLTIDLNNNGIDVFVFDLTKANDGSISLTGTTYQSVTSTIISANVYKASDLAGFTYPEFSFNKTDKESGKYYGITFSATKWNYSTGGNNSLLLSVLTKDYYALYNNVGYKVEDGPAFGVIFKKDNGKMGIMQDYNGDVQEFEK